MIKMNTDDHSRTFRKKINEKGVQYVQDLPAVGILNPGSCALLSPSRYSHSGYDCVDSLGSLCRSPGPCQAVDINKAVNTTSQHVGLMLTTFPK